MTMALASFPNILQGGIGQFLLLISLGARSSRVGISGICQPVSAGSQFSCHAKSHRCHSLIWNCPVGLYTLRHLLSY